jgi:protein-tyrosine phosphatase
MIEIHAHLLPGIDDGPETLQDSLALAQAFVNDGVRHVVATPHVFPGRFNNTRTTIEHAVEQFQKELLANEIDLAVQVAGEVRLSEDVIALFEQEELPYLGELEGYRTLLLELPDGQIPLGTDKLVAWLIKRGVRPVIAHPERNRVVRDRPEAAKELLDMGCLLQITAGALTGQFGSKVQQSAQALVKADWVSAVASDAHNLASRPPCLSSAFEWLSDRHGHDTAQRLCISGPAMLCSLSPVKA